VAPSPKLANDAFQKRWIVIDDKDACHGVSQGGC
jgi:hypothetical protein